MRLDRFVSKCTNMGRAQATKLVRKGNVEINSSKVNNPQTKVKLESDTVKLNGELLEYKEFIYIMLNKPQGYICSTKDDKHRTILDLFPEKISLREPHSCGRLDIDTTGLVLATDNGKWSHKVTSPKKKCFKTYIVQSDTPLTKEDMQLLQEGVLLDGEDKKTLPAQIRELGECEYELKICEGKFHQVKRMFQAVNNCVLALHRSKIGNIILDNKLKPGCFRELTPYEINEFL